MSVNIWLNNKLVPVANSGTFVFNVPLGSIIAFSGANIPSGFLLCDGRTLSKDAYLDLFNVIGYTYGGKNNEFRLPDLRDRFIQGANENLGENIEAGIPNITGIVSGIGGAQVPTGAFYSDSNGNAPDDSWSSRRIVKYDASKGETKTDGTLKTSDEHHVFGASDTVQPASMCLNYIIKATNYKDVPQSALDDSVTTTGNVWSASKTKAEIDARNIYFTEETVIGTWIDGKPIYRRVITFTNPVLIGNNEETILNNILNGTEKKIINFIETGYRQTLSKLMTVQPMVYADTNLTSLVIVQQRGCYVQEITMEYTKTTD